MPLYFEWDNHKAADNASKHGVTFEEAASSFGDPCSLTVADADHSESEDRSILLGLSFKQRLLVTVFTERGESVRIISARRASRSEAFQYEQRLPPS